MEKHTKVSDKILSAIRSYTIARTIQTYGRGNVGYQWVKRNPEKVRAHRTIFELAFNDAIINAYSVLCDSASRDGSKIRLEDLITDIADKDLLDKVNQIKTRISNYDQNSSLGILRNDVIAHNLIAPREYRLAIVTIGQDLMLALEILNLISEANGYDKINIDSVKAEVAFLFTHIK